MALIVEDRIRRHPPKKSWYLVQVWISAGDRNYIAYAFKDNAFAEKFRNDPPDTVIDGVYLYKGDLHPPPSGS